MRLAPIKVGWRYATALLPQLFGNLKNPRSNHKGATGRVRTGNQLLPVLCHCQLGQDIPRYHFSFVTVFADSFWLQKLALINCNQTRDFSQAFERLHLMPVFFGLIINLDLLLCTDFDWEGVYLFLFIQRLTYDWKIERSRVALV